MSLPMSEIEIIHEMDSTDKSWAMYSGYLGDEDTWARPPSEFDVQNEPPTRRQKLRMRSHEFLDAFTVHGPSRIYGAKHFIRRLVWLVVFLVCMVYGLLQCWKVYQEYRGHPKSVTVELKSESPVNFPAVTLCNLNPVNYKEQIRNHAIYSAFLKVQESNENPICDGLRSVVDDPLDGELCSSFDENCGETSGMNYYDYYVYDENYNDTDENDEIDSEATNSPDDESSTDTDNAIHPDVTSENPDETTGDPDETSASSDDPSVFPDETTSNAGDTVSTSDGTSSDDGTTSDETSPSSGESTSSSDESTSSSDESTSSSDGSTSSSDESTSSSDESTSSSDESTSSSDESTSSSDESTSSSDESTSSSDESTSSSDESTSSSDESTSSSDESTSSSDESTSSSDESTSSSDESTSSSDESTSSSDESTSSSDESTSRSDESTSGSDESTSTTTGISDDSGVDSADPKSTPSSGTNPTPPSDDSLLRKRRKRNTKPFKEGESSDDEFLEDLFWLSRDGNIEEAARLNKLSRQRRDVTSNFTKPMSYDHLLKRSQCSFLYQYQLKLASIGKRAVKLSEGDGTSLYLASYFSGVVGDFSECENEDAWLNTSISSKFNRICKENVFTDLLGSYIDVDKEYEETEVDANSVTLSCREGVHEKSTLWKKNSDRLFTEGSIATMINQSRTNDLSDLLRIFAPDIDLYENYSLARENFVEVCSMDGSHCNYKKFHPYVTKDMGVCYTFNSPFLADPARPNMTLEERRAEFVPLKSFNTGPQSGLSLTLNLNSEDYLALLSSRMGVRVVLHEPWEAPFPGSQGFDVSTGMLHSIGVKRKVMKRIGPPYGNCAGKDNPTFDYTESLCTELCFEREVRRKCHCAHNRGPAYGLLDNEKEFAGKTFNKCDPLDPLDGPCISAVSYMATTEAMHCGCHPACTEMKYSALISSTDVNREFLTIVQNLKKIPMGVDLCGTEYSTVRLHIYMESNTYEVVQESPAYTWTTLISNMGGNMGLFIGMSLVSLCEVLDFLFDVMLVLFFPSCYTCLQGSPAVETASRSPKKVIILAGPSDRLPHGRSPKVRPLRSKKRWSQRFNQVFMSD